MSRKYRRKQSEAAYYAADIRDKLRRADNGAFVHDPYDDAAVNSESFGQDHDHPDYTRNGLQYTGLTYCRYPDGSILAYGDDVRPYVVKNRAEQKRAMECMGLDEDEDET